MRGARGSGWFEALWLQRRRVGTNSYMMVGNCPGRVKRGISMCRRQCLSLEQLLQRCLLPLRQSRTSTEWVTQRVVPAFGRAWPLSTARGAYCTPWAALQQHSRFAAPARNRPMGINVAADLLSARSCCAGSPQRLDTLNSRLAGLRVRHRRFGRPASNAAIARRRGASAPRRQGGVAHFKQPAILSSQVAVPRAAG